MLCQNCNKEQASVHYKQVVNGAITEFHLCAHCAEEKGYGEIFNIAPSNLGFGLDSLLSHMMGGRDSRRGTDSCPLCGATADDISRQGRVGCARCYEQFADMLIPYIRRIHGNTSHTGRIPESATDELKVKRQLDSLRGELQKAIELQEFERAAGLRDEIKELEGSQPKDRQ